jgi:hypothetical protein
MVLCAWEQRACLSVSDEAESLVLRAVHTTSHSEACYALRIGACQIKQKRASQLPSTCVYSA